MSGSPRSRSRSPPKRGRHRPAALDEHARPTCLLVGLPALGCRRDRLPLDPAAVGLASPDLLRERVPALRLEGGGPRADRGRGPRIRVMVDVGAVSDVEALLVRIVNA